MPLARTRDLVSAAQRRRVGVGALNVITLEHCEGVVEGAERAGAPVILQLSENAVKFHAGRLAPIAAAAAVCAAQATVPVALHLDHVEAVALLHQADGFGISSVMFDASKLDHAANVAATRDAVEWAHEHGLYLEAELGQVGGKDGAHTPGSAPTRPRRPPTSRRPASTHSPSPSAAPTR